MSQERFLTVPSTGEVARPFEVLLDEASAALPADDASIGAPPFVFVIIFPTYFCAVCGSTSLRRFCPATSNNSTVAMSARPGNTASHQAPVDR